LRAFSAVNARESAFCENLSLEIAMQKTVAQFEYIALKN